METYMLELTGTQAGILVGVACALIIFGLLLRVVFQLRKTIKARDLEIKDKDHLLDLAVQYVDGELEEYGYTDLMRWCKCLEWKINRLSYLNRTSKQVLSEWRELGDKCGLRPLSNEPDYLHCTSGEKLNREKNGLRDLIHEINKSEEKPDDNA